MIEISGLTKKYGPHTVLDNIDFRVEQGQIAAVVGPSGAGKSRARAPSPGVSTCSNAPRQAPSGYPGRS